MSLNMHQVAIAPCIHLLDNLVNWLNKGESFATDHNFDSALLMGVRLYPDMYDLTRQVRSATTAALGLARHLSGTTPPEIADGETALADLRARVQAALAYLRAITPDQVAGSEDRLLTIKLGPREVPFKGANYALQFALPNFYFHVTSAYNILRHVGVGVGKRDFLAGYQAQ